MLSTASHLVRQGWGLGLRPTGEAAGVRLPVHRPLPRRAARRRRLLATLLALVTVIGAAASCARQAAAQPVPNAPQAPEAQPAGGLAASQVQLAEGIQAFGAGRDLEAVELLAAAAAGESRAA